jgi:alpha-galactosidase
MVKIAFIGGGSLGWAPTLIRDIIFKQGMEQVAFEFALLDVDQPRARAIKRLFDAKLKDWKIDRVRIYPTADPRRALKNADFVLITISTGRLEAMHHDIAVPEKYGIYHTVGDTAGPAGWARALRNIPIFKTYGRLIKELAPRAFVLNYTNPLACLTKVLADEIGSDRLIGLCHGLFENRDDMLRMFEVKNPNDLRLHFAGLNHFFWILDFTINGADGYEILRKKLKGKNLAGLIKESIGHDRLLANELFAHHGYLPYFGDRHTCEFFSCYITSTEVMQRLKLGRTPVSFRQAMYNNGGKTIQRWTKGTKEERAQFGPAPSWETAADIMKAVIFNEGFTDVMNFANVGQIDNLPRGAVVETMGYVDAGGARPITAGPLPESIRAILAPHAEVQLQTVAAGLSGNLEDALKALAADPGCAHLTAADARKLGRDLLEPNKRLLPQFFGR